MIKVIRILLHVVIYAKMPFHACNFAGNYSNLLLSV